METDLSIRLHAYSVTAAAQTPADTWLYAAALASSDAASTAASAAIICSHAWELRGDSPPAGLLPGQDELDLLAADKDVPQLTLLPLWPGNATVDDLARGADAIPAIKNQNA